MAAGTGSAILVVNPRSLAEHGLTAAAVRELLTAAGVRLTGGTLEPDVPPAVLLRRARAGGATLVVAAGGDGTVHLVANAIAGTALTLAVLPLGTANDFARALGLPTEPAAAAQVAAAGLTRPIDLGRVNGRYFLNAAHLGLGAETARRTDPTLKRWLGPIAYGLAAMRAWREAPPLALALRADGQTAVMQASQILIANGRFFGGGNLAGPAASLDDGLLDVQVMAPELPALALPRLAGALRRGDVGDEPEAIAFRTHRLEVTLSHPAPANLDGEVLALGDHLVFEVVPAALNVCTAAVSLTQAARDAQAPEARAPDGVR